MGRLNLKPYSSFDYSRVTGGELFARVAELDRLEEQEAVYFTGQILLGVNHMHQLGIVHLDLKVSIFLLITDISQFICTFKVLCTFIFQLTKLLYNSINLPYSVKYFKPRDT